ncbi:hypothetical protein MKW94_026620 [Papaver nudicaule]|uniref:Transposase Tnp1/En/Spm-like domain-containing protein n=1 Tax=Papaver nudicaule TaxID=74823 RepID=A0AA41VMB4_PAPNU|nr:hypothetical protein [Papaver nudicaule]
MERPKTFVDLNLAGVPIGDNASKFSTRAGDFIRIHIPVNKSDWRHVPINRKNDLWNALMNEFEFPVDHVRSIIESMFPDMYRRYKSDLRDSIRYPLGRRPRKAPKRKAVEGDAVVDEEVVQDVQPIELTPEVWEAAKSKVPEGMTSVIWEEFCDNEKREQKIANNAKNKAAREANRIRHTTGRCSYSNKKYKLDESGIKIVPPSTTDKWLLGHEGSDGSVHPSAVEKHKQVTAAKQRNEEQGASGSNSSLVISPELDEVFGGKRKEGIRGYSSHVSKKQGVIAALAEAAIHRRKTKNETRLDTIQSEVSQVAGQVSDLIPKVDAILHYLMKSVKGSANAFDSPAVSVDTPSPEKGSTSAVSGENGSTNSAVGGQKSTNPTVGVGKGSASAVVGRKVSTSVVRGLTTNRRYDDDFWPKSSIGHKVNQVELLDNRGKVVALGTLDGETICHGRAVKPHERKVYIEEIYDMKAVVWDGPQGDAYYTLSQLPLPNWLIWAESRLQPAEFDILI